MNRLFIAAEIPYSIIRDTISLKDKTVPRNNFRWEPAEKMHVTIKFLGDCNDETTKQLLDAIPKLSIDNTVSTASKGFATFIKNGQPVILHYELENSHSLLQLFKKVEDMTKTLGFVEESKPFRPHITMLRIKDSYDVRIVQPLLQQSVPKKEFRIENLILFKSVLQPGGSIYKKLLVHPLP